MKVIEYCEFKAAELYRLLTVFGEPIDVLRWLCYEDISGLPKTIEKRIDIMLQFYSLEEIRDDVKEKASRMRQQEEFLRKNERED